MSEEIDVTIEDRKDYEISFLVKEEADAEGVSRLLKQHSAEVAAGGSLKPLVLAYKIKKQTHAYFGYAHFSALPSSLPALQRDLETNPLILRFLVITPPFMRMRTYTPRVKPSIPVRQSAALGEMTAPSPLPLSNEALEKKIEEILQ
jgi:ribosomal protein S6